MDAKICGIKDSKTLNYLVSHNHPPKFIGFITNYPKSKRYIPYENLKELINIDKKKINFVSVLVNPTDEILEKVKDLNFDYYQLYDVSPERIKTIRNMKPVKIISAITINEKKDVNKYKDYLNISEIILFDGKGYEKSIGFDHNLLTGLPTSINKMIAGDIKIEDILKFKDKDFIIDISGSLENNEGKKDLEKINKLLNLAKEI